MASGAEHLKERVSEYLMNSKKSGGMDGMSGTLSGNWNEERFDSRLVSTGGKRAALPTELDHTWQSTYAHMNATRIGTANQAAASAKPQLSATTSTLLDLLGGGASSKTALSQTKLVDVVDGRHRAFPGHQPEQDLPGKDGIRPSEIPATTVVRESFISPEEQRRRQQVNAADLYYGPAHDKAAYVVFKLQQALQHRGISARAAILNHAATGAGVAVRTNFSFPALRRALFEAEREPPVPGIAKNKGKITKQELGRGLQAYGIPLEEAELTSFFKHLDRNGTGEVDVVLTVAAIRGAMNDRRRGITARAFALIEATLAAQKHIPHGQAVGVTMRDLLELFHAEAHPDVKSGAHTAEEVRRQLFEEFFSITDKRAREARLKAIVTQSEFSDMYEDWSALVAADHYFERSVRDCWHMSGGEGLAKNTSCRTVQVVHTNGRITTEEIIDDLGVNDGDEAAMRANLASQGIKDVKTITVLSGGRGN